MGNENRRNPNLLLNTADLLTGLHTQLRVEVGQRLVQKKYLRALYQRTGNRNTLLLTAGKSLRLTLHQLIELHQLRHLIRALSRLRLRNLTVNQREHDVILNGHVWIQGVVLEHQSDLTILRSNFGYFLIPEPDLSCRRLIQSGQHKQCR